MASAEATQKTKGRVAVTDDQAIIDMSYCFTLNRGGRISPLEQFEPDNTWYFPIPDPKPYELQFAGPTHDEEPRLAPPPLEPLPPLAVTEERNDPDLD